LEASDVRARRPTTTAGDVRHDPADHFASRWTPRPDRRGRRRAGRLCRGVQWLAICYAGRGRNLCTHVADCRRDLLQAVSVDGEGPREGPSVATSKVPVGGGVILENANYVVTQPSKGKYKAFSKICTHQGCPVASVANGVIHCNCHGSEYSIKDGSVTNPPAPKPLAEAKTAVFEGKIYVTG